MTKNERFLPDEVHSHEQNIWTRRSDPLDDLIFQLGVAEVTMVAADDVDRGIPPRKLRPRILDHGASSSQQEDAKSIRFGEGYHLREKVCPIQIGKRLEAENFRTEV